MVPSADIIPPKSGIPESEKMLPPLPASAADPISDEPLEFWYQIGT